MKRTPFTATGSLNQMIQAAEKAWAFKDYQGAIKSLQSASRLAPANTSVLLRLGSMSGLRYDYSTAERCFEKALRLTPKKNEIIKDIISHCLIFRNLDLAEHYLRHALAQPEATPQTCTQLAELYERLRRVPEAVQLVERALTSNPSYPAALLVRARLERLAGKLDEAEQTLRSFITQTNLDTWTHAQAWYELATVLDRHEKYDEAMAAFLKAKLLLLPQAPEYLQALKQTSAYLKVMEENVSADLLRRWFENGPVLPPSRRLALLCGHARSGTTLLEQILDADPDIVSAEETRTMLDEAYSPLARRMPPGAGMLDILELATNPGLQQSRAAYFRSMDLEIGGPVGHRLLLDKNPVINCLIPAFVRIFPETKFLVALRDPRDVVLSCFMQPHPLNTVTAAYLSLEGTAEDYTAVMSLWRTLAPLMPSPYLEVRYEDMVADLESVARKTLNYLGVPWNERVLGFNEHARQKLVRTPTYADVTQPIYQRARGRWRNYQKYLEPHLEPLEPFVKMFGYD
jgi:tetratricopeptide (TPR) repeat protein